MVELMYDLLNTLYGALQLITGLVALYQLILSVFGFIHRRRQSLRRPQKRFAIVVPAHNEERVVGPLIDSLKAQDYPRHLYDIHVIADNCSDHTADVAEHHGAIVHRRTSADQRGKGYAIEWIISELDKLGVAYDALAMFDADNLVDREFLSIMNDHLCRGGKVIQGYLGVKNPFDTWVSVSLAISYWFDNRMWQNARQNLGISCALGGTGLCIDRDVLKDIGWKATGLTEDLEFGVRCLRNGIVPIWAHDAKVYDEKPTGFTASFRQRLRWQQGHFQCAKEHLFPLVWEGIVGRSLAKFDMAVYLFQPMRSLLLFLAAVMLFLVHFSPASKTGNSHFIPIIPTNIWVIVNVLLFAQMPLALILERINWRAYFGLAVLPFFLWTWGPVTFQAYLTRSNKKWYHTPHKRAIRLDELRGR